MRFRVFIALFFTSALPASALQDQGSATLEVTIRPYGEATPVVTFDELYMDLGDGRRLSFREWLRRSFGESDGVVSGATTAEFYELEASGFDPARLNKDSVDDLLSPRFKGRSFINIGLDLGYDPEARRPGISLSRGIYGPKPIVAIDRADEEFGVINLSGGKKISF